MSDNNFPILVANVDLILTNNDRSELNRLIERSFEAGIAKVVIRGHRDGLGALVQSKDIYIKAGGTLSLADAIFNNWSNDTSPALLQVVRDAANRHDQREIIDESAAAAAAYCRIAYNK